MATVTQRIVKTKQPKGGFINPKSMTAVKLNSEMELFTDENIHATLIGLAVDYLSRFMTGTPAEEAFKISMMGAWVAKQPIKAQEMLDCIIGLDDTSIEMACKLVGFDVCCRAGTTSFKGVDDIEPNNSTIANIREMVNRSLRFFEEYGPVTLDGFQFPGGYTELVNNGDGDFLTEDTLWDMKVLSKEPTKNHTLQILMYYLMGIHSDNKDFFNSINKLGIFSPRMNTAYYIAISDIPKDVVEEVSTTVIGY